MNNRIAVGDILRKERINKNIISLGARPQYATHITSM